MKRYLIFVAVGPALGGFVLLMVTTYQSGYWIETNADEIAKLFKVFVVSLQYSYLFGFLPALMICAIDDILFHVRRIGPSLRMLLVGIIAFCLAALNYASHGADYGLLQFVLYGLVGFIPATISSWLVYKFVDEPLPVPPPAQSATESR
jgi:glucan phosphoethanolaminetransferase (alkaline phosphatase superfamily)